MAKRKIINIDEDLCTGCGECITGCAEGALALVAGKAKLVKEQFCDGFGDCIGTCPTGALKIEERESDEFDSEATKQYLRQTQGDEAVRKMEDAARAHEEGRHPGKKPDKAPGPAPGGCPGSRMRTNLKSGGGSQAVPASGMPGHVNESELDQWPVQLHLVQPGAPFFEDRELVVLSTCSPIASADVHWRFMRGRAVVVGCPKLDRTEPYVGKLAAILSEPTIPRVIVVRMEVPCCGGLTAMVREAVKQSGRKDLGFEEVTIGINGDIAG
ncbi:MAG: 4Fe-4S dicluster domain-containing protein [Candidatus Eisenbacteria bacterium]